MERRDGPRDDAFVTAFAAATLLSVVLTPRPGLAGATASGSCVDCHRRATGVAYVEHNFADWKKSVHAAAGVGCEACHGGDPAAKEAAAAHAGVVKSSDPASALYYTRIPETCGKCHQDILKAFKTSRHYHELTGDSGKGPNCVTCHGAMANFILEPRMIQMTCTLCHRQPSGAQAALMSLNNAGVQLGRLKAALAKAKAAGVASGPQRAAYDAAKARHDETKVAWHAFDMPAVLKTSQEITRSAATALNELALKQSQR